MGANIEIGASQQFVSTFSNGEKYSGIVRRETHTSQENLLSKANFYGFGVAVVKAAVPLLIGAAISAVPAAIPYALPVGGVVSAAYLAYKAISYLRSKPVEVVNKVTKFIISNASSDYDYYLVSNASDCHWDKTKGKKLDRESNSDSHELVVDNGYMDEFKLIRVNKGEPTVENAEWEDGDNHKLESDVRPENTPEAKEASGVTPETKEGSGGGIETEKEAED